MTTAMTWTWTGSGTSLLLTLLLLVAIDDYIRAFSPTDGSPLRVMIVGAGPSGQLISHLLLRHNEQISNDNGSRQNPFHVTMVESGSDPRTKDAEGRAYALGIGIRGRTAVRDGVDDELWKAIKARGFESERFQLQLFGGSLVIPLRSEEDSKLQEENDVIVEPSVLMYQTELCAAMMDELERRKYQDRGWLRVFYNCKIDDCDLSSMSLTVDDSTHELDVMSLNNEKFDLIVGCDGVNSVVREAIEQTHPRFECTKRQLPGEFKVVRLQTAPPTVDPSSVSLILPKSGSTTAFVEPTSQDGECCILFASNNEDDPVLSETTNTTRIEEALNQAFPQWDSLNTLMSEQLVAQTRPGQASSVTCNTYHYRDRAVLVGDAAHATGGVSGQGVNSALADSLSLAQSLINGIGGDSTSTTSNNELADALMEYSIRQVPEGKALYDLSFGPKPRGVIKALGYTLMNIRDALFRGRRSWLFFGITIGRPPLQTRLTTSLTPFSTIRQEMDEFYDEKFPDHTMFKQQLSDLHQLAMTTTITTTTTATTTKDVDSISNSLQ